MPSHNCPKCGKKGECFSREVGDGNTYKDEYTFICEEGHESKKVLSGGSLLGENWLTNCPFCTKDTSKHKSPPD